MSLIRYIQGVRKGNEINRLERKAMEDPFLADALEGFDQVHGNHEARIKRVQDKIFAQTRPSNSTLHYWSIAASILLIIGIAGGGYFLWNQFNEPKTVLVAESILKPLDTITSEKLEEISADSFAEQEMKMDYAAGNNRKQPEAIIVKDEEVTSLPNMDKLPAADTDTVQPTPVDLAEHKVLAEVINEAQKKSIAVPEPVIGLKAYNDYLKKNLIRPTDEECKNATGVVTLTFSIDKNGRPYNIHITKSLCPLADWEAMRLVKEGADWTAGESIATVNVYF